MAPPSSIMSETARYTLTMYMLITTSVAFYMIYWASQTNFVNDNKWISDKGIDNDKRNALRTSRDVYYYFSIGLVLANFLMFLYLFGTKFIISTRY